MALGALTLVNAVGVAGRAFRSKINGLTTGRVEVVAGAGAPGFGIENGLLVHAALPGPGFDPVTVLLRELEPGAGTSSLDTRLVITSVSKADIDAQAVSLIGVGRSLRRMLLGSTAAGDGTVTWQVSAEDDFGSTAIASAGGAPSPSPTPTPAPGPLANTFMIAGGDSRIAGGGGYANSAGSMFSRVTNGNGMGGALFSAIDNRLLPRRGYNYGVGSISTRNLEIRARQNSIAATTGAATPPPGNPAQSETQSTGTGLPDTTMSSNSDGTYSLNADPAAVYFSLCSVNDGTAYYSTAGVSMTSYGRHLDDRIAGNAAGVIYLADGHPRGTQTIQNRKVTTTAGAQYTVTGGDATGLIDGESFGAPGAMNTAGVLLTKVVGAPASAAEYSVSGAVYTFHASLASSVVYITYGCDGAGTADRLVSMRDWVHSSLGSGWSDTLANVWAVNGARFGRPAVKPVLIWNKIAKATTGADNRIAKHGTLDSTTTNTGAGALHFTQYGALLAAEAWTEAFETDHAAMPSLNKPPLGQVAFVKAGGAVTTQSGTLPDSFTGVAGFRANTHFRALDNSGTLHALLINDGNGVFTVANIIGSLTLSVATLAANGDFAFTGASNWLPANGRLSAEMGEWTGLSDHIYANLVHNPHFDTAAAAHIVAGSLPANYTGTPVPGWTFTSSTGVTNALAGTAGNMTVAVSQAIVTAGKRKLIIECAGLITAAGSHTITISPGSVFRSAQRITPGQLMRGGLTRTLKPGANGRCYGVMSFGTAVAQLQSSANISLPTSTGASFSHTDEFTGTVTPASANATILQSNSGAHTPGFPWDDLVVNHAGGAYTETRITPEIDTTGATVSTGLFNIVLAFEGDRPFSFIAEIEDPWLRIVTS